MINAYAGSAASGLPDCCSSGYFYPWIQFKLATSQLLHPSANLSAEISRAYTAASSRFYKDVTQAQLSFPGDFLIECGHFPSSNAEGKYASSGIDRAIIGTVRSH